MKCCWKFCRCTETDRNKIKSIPNFDAEIFEQCTGIKIESEGK